MAYEFLSNLTELEYRNSSPMCKRAIQAWNKNHGNVLSFVPAKAKEDQDTLIWHTGGWHYCGGVIRIQRGEVAVQPYERQKNLEGGISNATYTWSRIDKTEPWAAEIGTTIARAYRALEDREKATEYLEKVLQFHKSYAPAYMIYGLLSYDQGDYQKAIEYFETADQLEGGRSAQTAYFLGLAYIKMGDVESAKKYASEARRLGYPLTGLSRLIAREESSNP